MSYLRHALNLFLLLMVLALTVPTGSSQDTTKSDDATSQSDRSDDQSNDPVTLNDFIFEHASILHRQIRREICLQTILPSPETRCSPSFSSEHSFLPHLLISNAGLMPRAPAQA